MKITNSNYTYSPQFKSKYFETLTKSANLKKPFEKMTVGDCHVFSAYINSLNFRMGLTAGDIKKLLANNGADFINSVSKFFIEKLGFSSKNAPPIILINGTLGGAPCGYSLEQNLIYLTSEYENISKPQLFGLLRHEYQHAIQNHNILRTEGLGEEAVECYAERLLEQQRNVLIDYAENYSVNELVKQGGIDKSLAVLVSELGRALEVNDKKTVDILFNRLKQSYILELNNFRKKLIKEKGLIKADSKAGEKAKIHFEDFKNIDYYDNNGNLDIGKHAVKITEIESELSQLMAESEISQTCFIKIIKDNLNKLKTNKEYKESIEKEIEKACDF